jgi:predicted CXXCH cytochrome family protein
MRRFAAAAALVFAAAGAARAQRTILSTKHNLSTSGPGPVRSPTETQVCIFCHVPHHGLGHGSNRPESTATYVPYNSTTMTAAPGSPTGASKICLSCHDGTIAPGQTVASGLIPLSGTSGGFMPGISNLGTDLRKSHPVSFPPPTSPRLRAPPPGDPVRLDPSGALQCTSCHDPHFDGADAIQGKFLVKSNRQSAICTTCHVQPFWSTNPSAHQVSTKRFDASLGASTAYTTVADNACESCHRPHSAVAQGGRLLKAPASQTCQICHGGQVAQQNIGLELTKPFAHPVLGSDPALHDESESPTSGAFRLPETNAAAQRHVQCADCHNPHAVYDRPAIAPAASGLLSGVWGIDQNGVRVDQVQYEYQVCFKCHADSANQPQRNGPTPPETLRRTVIDVNLRRRLDPSTAASFHPVVAPGAGRDVPSLIAPLTASSVLYCGDCHGSESALGPRGPHGSAFRHILAANLSTADRTPESPSAYALCYKCHDRTSILSDNTFLHRLHVVDQSAPCTTCHDAHGVSALQGNAINNAHLIDFDTSIVRAANGVIRYTSTGARSGNCTLTCHGETHTNFSYRGGSGSSSSLPRTGVLRKRN